jgi:hypothetical protein
MMRPEEGFAGTTRVVKVSGHGRDRHGLVVKWNWMSGMWEVLFDGDDLAEPANPGDFDRETGRTEKNQSN